MIQKSGAWIEVNLQKLHENYQKLEKFYQDKVIFPVVKANAYGHGMIEIAKFFDHMGVPIICVSHVHEAMRLLEEGIKSDILVFGWTHPDLMAKFDHPQIIYTLSSMIMYQEIQTLPSHYRFHIKVNSSMNRVGFKSVLDIARILKESRFQYEGIYTHLPSKCENEESLRLYQRFEEMIADLNHPFKWVHVGNTNPHYIQESEILNGVRMGMALYGYDPYVDVKPILSLYAPIEYVTKIRPGESVGYDFMYRAEHDEIIASIPLGYAHGFYQEQAAIPLKLGEDDCEIVGKVCMDQSMIKVEGNVKVGDILTVYGDSRSAMSLSKKIGRSHYELLTQLSSVIPRKYLRKTSK